jgi:hypothetical protein
MVVKNGLGAAEQDTQDVVLLDVDITDNVEPPTCLKNGIDAEAALKRAAGKIMVVGLNKLKSWSSSNLLFFENCMTYDTSSAIKLRYW